MATSTSVERANKVLDEEIAVLKEKVAAAKRRPSRQPGASGAVSSGAQADQAPSPPGAPQPSAAPHSQGVDHAAEIAVHVLEERLRRATQIKQWITEDHDLLPLMANAVGKTEKDYSRKQLFVNILLSTVFLFAGWLLSIAGTPAVLGDLLKH